MSDAYRVLVVDDEDAIVELVGEYLRARGHEVFTCGNGDDALALVEREQLDVVLTDLRLPARGGMSLLEALHQVERPVAAVVMTGYGTVETAVQAMKHGATEYLLKPVRLREVYDALVQAVADGRARRSRLRDQARVALYEAALGLGGEVGPDDLARRLAEALRHERSAVRGVVVALQEGGVWRAAVRWGDVGDDSTVVQAQASLQGTGVRLALWGAAMDGELLERMQGYADLALRRLVHSGAGDLPRTA